MFPADVEGVSVTRLLLLEFEKFTTGKLSLILFAEC